MLTAEQTNKAREACRRYYASHREQRLNEGRVYRDSKGEELKAKKRLWMRRDRLDHPEKYLGRGRRNYYRDVEKSRMEHRIRYHNEGYNVVIGRSEKTRLETRKRRAIMRWAGKLTRELIQRVYEANIKLFGTLTCYLCCKPIKFGDDNLEHKTPITRGGKNVFENLRVAHACCNQRKGHRTYEECLLEKLF